MIQTSLLAQGNRSKASFALVSLLYSIHLYSIHAVRELGNRSLILIDSPAMVSWRHY